MFGITTVLFPQMTSFHPSGCKQLAGRHSESKDNAGPARYLVNTLTGQRLGVIAAVTHHFCDTCNRLRITSTGQVLPCLFSQKGVNISNALRERDEEMVKKGIIEAIKMKPRRWLDMESGDEHMSRIGG